MVISGFCVLAANINYCLIFTFIYCLFLFIQNLFFPQIGFNAGNGTQSYEYKPYSQASVLRDLTGRGWANGFPGRHIFRIDEKILMGTCNKDIGKFLNLEIRFCVFFSSFLFVSVYLWNLRASNFLGYPSAFLVRSNNKKRKYTQLLF